MMSISAFLFLALSIGAAVAFEEDVDCEHCILHNGLGYVKSKKYAVAYYVCIPFRDGFRVETQCCSTGMTFDQEHLTCVVDKKKDLDPNEDWCPKSTFEDGPCPFICEDGEKEFYSILTGEAFECAPGTWWKQKYCTCVHGKYVKPCSKIMHFDFEDSYDSESCNYIIDGTPHGETKLGGSLCLYGKGYVAVAFLYNWFAWNPIADDFTFCARANPRNANSTGCIFSTNCDSTDESSLLELGLVDGELAVMLGSDTSVILDVELPVGIFSQICVTYVRGHYTVCVDDVDVYHSWTPNMPINSQTESYIGKNEIYGGFDGYIDDVCFWTEARTKAEIAADHQIG